MRRIQCGINIDPENPHGLPTTRQIHDLGATWVRFSYKDHIRAPYATGLARYEGVVDSMAQAGINVLLVLSYETYPGKPGRDSDACVWDDYIGKLSARCRQIAARFGARVRAYEVWNEPDLAPGAHYDPTVPAAAYSRLLRAVHGAIRDVSSAIVVMGGLAAGQPDYVRDVQIALGGALPVDAIAVHPYGRRPTADWPRPDWGRQALSMTELLVQYGALSGIPIWISEVGCDDLAVQGQFPERTFEALDGSVGELVPCAFWYCWSDGMVAPWGLVRSDGTKKAAYDSFRAFAIQPYCGAGLPPTDLGLLRELLRCAEEHQCIQLNPQASLQRSIFADGFVPNSAEFDVTLGGETYRGQRAERLGTGEVRVYWAKPPGWGDVRWLARPAAPKATPTVVDRPSVHLSQRRGEGVRYIIVHSTDSPTQASPQSTLSYLVGPNDREVSAHEVVLPEGQVYRLVPDEWAAHHAESTSVRFPDGTRWQRANESTWGVEAYQVRAESVREEVVETTMKRVAAACKRLGLGAPQVLGHREIDPSRKTDPVGVDMDKFRAAVQELLLEETLLTAAEERLALPLNPSAALQRRILSDGLVPTSPEFDVDRYGLKYRAQRGEHLGTGQVRVYYVWVPAWQDVGYVEREER